MRPPTLRACHCQDRRPGNAWIDPIRETLQPGGKVLIECPTCTGVLVLVDDGMGRVTIAAPTAGLLLADFSSWLKEAAAASALSPEAVADEVGRPWLQRGVAAGCQHCLAVRPEPYVQGLVHVASSEGLDELYQCPRCGAFRWKTFEAHGFAEAEVWGQATRDDLRQFQWYLAEESQKRGISQDDLIESIFQRCV